MDLDPRSESDTLRSGSPADHQPATAQSAVDEARQWLADRGVSVSLLDTDRIGGSDRAREDRGQDRTRERARNQGRNRHRSEDRGRGDRPDGEVDPDADQESVARTIALRKLAAQARTRHELAEAMAKKQVPDEAADAVLDRLTDVGLIDDAQFARDWVDSRQVRRQLSGTALRRELSAKGVDRDTVDAALAEVGAEDEREIALGLARRRFRTMSTLPRDVARRRLAGVLGRRGFSSDVVRSVIEDVLSPNL